MRILGKAMNVLRGVTAASRRYQRAIPKHRQAPPSLSLVLCLFLGGCGWHGKQTDRPPRTAPTDSQAEGKPQPARRAAALTEQDAVLIHARASTWFANAVLYKPVPREPADLAWTLAPLIIQEVSADNRSVPPFAQAPPETPGIQTNLQLPSLYFASDVIQIRERPHPRFTYWWSSSHSDARRGDMSAVQGVRLTLDSSGAPVIWEVLADPSGADVTFVARSLEQAAEKEFGAPLAGRRFAIETSLSNAPNTVVARVIDDGPVPMGPILYLSADGGTILTLICRCMPAQASNLVSTSYYHLVAHPLPPMPTSAISQTFAPQTGRSADASRADNEAHIEMRLRLPPRF